MYRSHPLLTRFRSFLRPCLAAAVLLASSRVTATSAQVPAGPRTTQPIAAASAAAMSAPLEVGDLVRVTVWRRPELSGDFRIGADGSLRHPLYQDVKVSGLTVPEAQTRLQTFLKQLEATPQIVLEPLLRVSVGGEIRSPNLYSLPPETSIAQVIALAGGPTERGRLDRVRLVRNGRSLTLDLTDAGSATTEMPIRSGDQLFIGRQSDTLRDTVLPIVGLLGSVAAIASFVRR